MGLELRDLDANEAAEPVASSTTETENPVEEPVVETPKPAEEPAQAPTEEPVNVPAEAPVATPIAPEQPKRSRAEERIKNLAFENRRLKDEMAAFSQQTAPELQGEELIVGDIDRVINQRSLQAAELLIAGKQVENEYQAQVADWAKDFEETKAANPALDQESPDYDPELDSTLARLLDDGTGNGTPRTDIKVSEILKTLSKRETATQIKAREEGKNQANTRLAQQMSESAITPGSKLSSQSEELSDDEMADLRTKNPKEWLKRL